MTLEKKPAEQPFYQVAEKVTKIRASLSGLM